MRRIWFKSIDHSATIINENPIRRLCLDCGLISLVGRLCDCRDKRRLRNNQQAIIFPQILWITLCVRCSSDDTA